MTARWWAERLALAALIGVAWWFVASRLGARGAALLGILAALLFARWVSRRALD